MFFFSKLLALLPFGNFLRGPLGQLAMYAIIALAAYLGFQYWLHQHDNMVKQEVLIEFNHKQEELFKQKEAEYQEKLKQANDTQEQYLAEIMTEINRLKNEKDDLIKTLRDSNLKGGDASEILRGAIRLLQERR